MLLQFDEGMERLRQIDDPDTLFLVRVAITVLLTHESDFRTRPEPIDVVAFVDAMEIIFSKKDILEAAVEGRLDELRWWPDEDDAIPSE